MKLKIERYMYSELFDSLIKDVNTIISRDTNGHKMDEIVNSLRLNNYVKKYTFNKVKKRLKEMNVTSYF
ncbi:MAG: hypothetical protein WBA54_07255 [Acidaminobacteraceae bacterium]